MLPLLAGCTLLTDDFHAARIDADGDGAIATTYGGSDCDDADAAIHPDATETCDTIDQDCDGTPDDGVTLSLYTDADGDGFGDAATQADACAPSTGQVLDGTDCDDSNLRANPSATELCNGVDDDCDGTIDEDQAINTFYRDDDGDGFGTDETIDACAVPTGYASETGDCDDSDSTANPGDADGDGFPACDECDDTDTAVNPDAIETCNDIDDDCDGAIDDDAGSIWYTDADGDGYGTGAVLACAQPAGSSALNGDCDDTDATAVPGGTETCDDVDNDCDGTADEDTGSLWYTDADGDGYGSGAVLACAQPSGTSTMDGDCDDTDPTVSPSENEICNDGIDQDCDGLPADCGIAASGSMAEADVSILSGVGHATGYSVDAGENVNGDYYDDFLVGVPNWASPTGAALLAHGIPGSISDADDASVKFYQTGSIYIGLDVELTPDGDGDGDGEVLLSDSSLPGYWLVHGGPYGRGYGVDDEYPMSKAAGSFEVTTMGWNPEAEGLTDADGDGFAEFLLRDESSPAVVYLFAGSAGLAAGVATASITGTDEHFGYSIADVGDTDGDGVTDFAVGSPGSAGAFYLFSGDLTGTVDPSAAIAERSGSYLGGRVAAAGDVDGDGFDDLLVGARTAEGFACLWLGPIAGTGTTSDATTTFVPTATDGLFGIAISAGDVDGDGEVDVAISAPAENAGIGSVYLFLGALGAGTIGTADADSVLSGENVDDYAGSDLSLRGDFDADGFADLLIGVPGGSTTLAGAYVFSGGGV